MRSGLGEDAFGLCAQCPEASTGARRVVSAAAISRRNAAFSAEAIGGAAGMDEPLCVIQEEKAGRKGVEACFHGLSGSPRLLDGHVQCHGPVDMAVEHRGSDRHGRGAVNEPLT
jgi:hypothetical protein